MSSEHITVLVADDHPLYREGVTRAVRQSQELRLVGEAQDGRQALALIREHSPEVALLDVGMPGLDGLRVLNAVRRDGLSTRVVLLAGAVAAEVVYRALAGGAAGFVTKEASREEICAVVVDAARGRMRLPTAIQGQLVEQIRLRALQDRPRLTERESEVLRYVGEGLLAPDIALAMSLSTATVKSHLQTLYDKLGVSDRAAAVAVAMRAGLME